jgi:hypothetical protein
MYRENEYGGPYEFSGPPITQVVSIKITFFRVVCDMT